MVGTDRHEDIELRARTRIAGIEIDTESVLDVGIDSDPIANVRADETQKVVVAPVDETAAATATAQESPGMTIEDTPTKELGIGHGASITGGMVDKLALGGAIKNSNTRNDHSESGKNWDGSKGPHDLQLDEESRQEAQGTEKGSEIVPSLYQRAILQSMILTYNLLSCQFHPSKSPGMVRWTPSMALHEVTGQR